jgi:hypothetical protein
MAYNQSEIDRWAEIESEDSQASSRIVTALLSHCRQMADLSVSLVHQRAESSQLI